MKTTVLVIFGGNSAEHDISVITGVETLNAMPVKGFKVIPTYLREGVFYTGDCLFDIKSFIQFTSKRLTKIAISGKAVYSDDGRGKLKKLADVDCALLGTHGGDGENGALQGFLEINGIPHTSASVRESAVCMDKILTKQALSALGVRVVEGYEVNNPANDKDIDALEKKLAYPIIVKPSSQGSSIGISIARNREELVKALSLASHFSKGILAEKALKDITEINSGAYSVNGSLVLSEIEKPLTASDFLTYGDKYMGGGKGMGGGRREFPAKTSEKTRTKILDTTSYVYKALGLFGVVRMDYLVQGEDVYLNEINTIPGSLAHYLFPGIAHSELLKSLVESAIARGVPEAPKYVTNVLSNIGAKHK